MTQSRLDSRRSFLKSAATIGGAAGLGLGTVAAQPSNTSVYPTHNERTRGWLRFIWEKATTPDNWDYSEGIELPWGIQIPRGEIDWTVRDDRPHPWWDQLFSLITNPCLNYHCIPWNGFRYVFIWSGHYSSETVRAREIALPAPSTRADSPVPVGGQALPSVFGTSGC